MIYSSSPSCRFSPRLASATRLTLALYLALSASISAAATIVAEGRSAVANHAEHSREVALHDAVKNALAAANSQAASKSAAKSVPAYRRDTAAVVEVSDLQVLHEYESHGFYHVTIQAEVLRIEPADCQASTSPPYLRSILFTAFPREIPQSTSVGQLHNVETDLPLELGQRLQSRGDGLAKHDRAPVVVTSGHLSAQDLSQAVQLLGEAHAAQFVVAGSVVDMSMLYPDLYYRHATRVNISNRIGGTIKDHLRRPHRDSRERVFGFRLAIYDGHTGVRLVDKIYSGTGLWDAQYAATVGFASPAFWRTDYGQMASQLIDEVVNDLRGFFLCQPYQVPARVLTETTTVHLAAGANHGIQIGDSAALHIQYPLQVPGYQVSAAESAAIQSGWRSMNNSVEARIIEVYPDYSVAESKELLSPGGRYTAVFQ